MNFTVIEKSEKIWELFKSDLSGRQKVGEDKGRGSASGWTFRDFW